MELAKDNLNRIVKMTAECDSKFSAKLLRMSSVRCGRNVLLCKTSSTLQRIIRYFLKPKKAIGRERFVYEAAAGLYLCRRFMCRGFEIETISAANRYLVLPGQYKCPFSLLTVYDPDITVLAKRRLCDGNADAINGRVVPGDN